MASSRFREWVEARLPWYNPHAERLRNVRSELIARQTAAILEDVKRVIDRQHVIDSYEQAEAQRVRAKP